MPSDNRNARLFWPVLIAIVAVDVVTKRIAVQMLGDQQRVPHEVQIGRAHV